MMRAPMVSSTQQFSRIRKRKARRAGNRRKREMRAHGTPAFPLQPEGYDPKAPDAKPAAAATATAEKK
jgi:hypothetical protein